MINTYNILRQFIKNRDYAPEELYQEVIPVWNCYLPGSRVSMTLRATSTAEVHQPNAHTTQPLKLRFDHNNNITWRNKRYIRTPRSNLYNL
jgi:hypothetical protein